MKTLTKSKTFLSSILFYLIMFTAFILMFILNIHTPLVNDDLNYTYSFETNEKIDSLTDIPSSMIAHYNKTNARLYTHSLAQIFLFLEKSTFNIINSIAFVLLGLLIYFHIIGSLKNKKPEILTIIYSSLFLFAPAFGQSFLWLTGASNYLYGILTILITLIPFRKYILHKGNKSNNLFVNCIFSSIMFMAGLICGNSNENNSVAFLCIIVMNIIYVAYNEKKVIPWMLSTSIGSFLGLATILFSPGQSVRLAGAGGFNLQEIIINFFKHTISLFTNFSTLFIFAILLIVASFIKENITTYFKNFKFKYIIDFINKNFITISYLVALLASVYSMIVAPYFPLRTWSGPLVFIIIFIGSLYTSLESKKIFYTKKYVISLALLLAFISACTYFGDTLPAIKNDENQIFKRIELINIAKSNNISEVEIPSIKVTSKYSIFYSNPSNSDFLSYDSSEWPNRIIAKYYGIEKIIRNDSIPNN